MKGQDVLLLVLLAAHPEKTIWSYSELSQRLYMSLSVVHASVQRAALAHLLDRKTRTLEQPAFLEFAEHAVKYLLPARTGPSSQGLPTAGSAAPLKRLVEGDPFHRPLVWPDPSGPAQGESLEPLYPSVIRVARSDPKVHEWLALIDAIRGGRPRERELAVLELRRRLG